MTTLDTLRRMRDARPSHRCGGCELCRERAALTEAIRVMEREAADERETAEAMERAAERREKGRAP